jgi:hypothetical protein
LVKKPRSGGRRDFYYSMLLFLTLMASGKPVSLNLEMFTMKKEKKKGRPRCGVVISDG